MSRVNFSKPAKPVLSYLIPSHDAIQDSITKQWTIVKAFDAIIIPRPLDSYYQTFRVFGRIEDVPKGASKTEIDLVHEDGTMVHTATLEGTLDRGFVVFGALFELVNFEKTGEYHFRVRHNNKLVPGGNRFYFVVVKAA